ncbi:trypsin-2-like [Cylas formicarius]|uniref:trypsin-2-like n=1 Tax=Cylas formicarius TaxID=197179 RepID=UPI00295875A0|nr:trypsin-2-like [Cylas formicarius]
MDAPWSEGAKVILGAHNISQAEADTRQTLRSEEIIIHDGFSYSDNADDIAVLKLSQPAVLNEYVQPVGRFQRDREWLGLFRYDEYDLVLQP